MKKITVVEVNDICMYPPVQNLVAVLLDNGFIVDLIGCNASKVSVSILNNSNFRHFDTPSLREKNKLKKWNIRLKLPSIVKSLVIQSMKDSDYLWTTSMNSIRTVGELALKYKNVLQLMELAQYGYRYKNIIKFPVEQIAQKSWKIVVPEINRAYIQRTWWKLKRTPYVLPNKPHDLEYGEINGEVQSAIDIMKNEKRKIVLYLGGVYEDRNFEGYAKAISQLDGYVLYIVGKAFSKATQNMLNDLKNRYPVVYLGAFNPPKHLAVVKYAHIGLLPYKPAYGGDLSELNALYCAPNKIFEYAGFGVPMVGSDMLGLKFPFEKWNIGYCCDDSSDAFLKALKYIDNNYEEISRNCYKYYDSVNLNHIVNEILEDY